MDNNNNIVMGGAIQAPTIKGIFPNESERLILQFQPFAYCKSSSSGLTQFDVENLPLRLRELGVTTRQWDKWMRKYQDEVQPYSNMCLQWSCMTLAGMLIIPGILMLFCPISKNSTFQIQLKEWLQFVNCELPEGCYVKTQTVVTNFASETSMISFALTHEESDRLMVEPIMVMERDCCQGKVFNCEKDRVV